MPYAPPPYIVSQYGFFGGAEFTVCAVNPPTIVAECRDLAAAKFIVHACNCYEQLLTACKAVIDWADKENMPEGGKRDGPWKEIEAAITKAEEH